MLRRAREQKIFHETNTPPSLFPMREVNQQEGSDLLSTFKAGVQQSLYIFLCSLLALTKLLEVPSCLQLDFLFTIRESSSMVVWQENEKES